jgi:hypothetical protein
MSKTRKPSPDPAEHKYGSHPKAPASADASPGALSRLVPGWHPLPFLEEGKAQFQDALSPQELDARTNGQLIAVPPPRRSPPILALQDVIGSDDTKVIDDSGQIVFHVVGDTGLGLHSNQTDVAEAMALDYHRPNPADHPAFFFHLGDVCYSEFHGPLVPKASLYQPQFYQPYADYPGKILAIAGNHDCNPQEDPRAIETFEDNFCAPAGTPEEPPPLRSPVHEPGVYFLLEAPYVRIIGLCSNGGETQGMISGPIAGSAQKAFLIAQLRSIKAKREAGDKDALIVAMHHPPYSGGGHTGSQHMSGDLDDAFRQAGLAPDAIFSGHAHNFQRFTRTLTLGGVSMEIPYIVAGNGGHGMTPVKPGKDRKSVKTPLSGAGGDVSLRQYYNGYGYLVVTVTSRVLTIDAYSVHPHPSEVPFDSVTVSLQTHRVTSETQPLEHPLPGEGRGAAG